ncbi:MAG: hypothetical protein ACW96U_12455 [Candidatus Heimdallarchaeaceae archaeon]
MKEIFCPNCGQIHKSEGQFCEYCGNDLEKVILQFKQDQLPIRYQAAERTQTYQQGPVSQQRPERVSGGRRSSSARISSIIFMIASGVILILYFFTGFLPTFIFYVLIGIFGVSFLISSMISSAVNPRRHYRRSSYCYGPCYCSGNECDSCDACSSSGCDCGDCGGGCGDCGDCGGGCGDCGDCAGGCGDCGDCAGGCGDCTHNKLGFFVALFYLIFSKNEKNE